MSCGKNFKGKFHPDKVDNMSGSPGGENIFQSVNEVLDLLDMYRSYSGMPGMHPPGR